MNKSRIISESNYETFKTKVANLEKEGWKKVGEESTQSEFAGTNKEGENVFKDVTSIVMTKEVLFKERMLFTSDDIDDAIEHGIKLGSGVKDVKTKEAYIADLVEAKTPKKKEEEAKEDKKKSKKK